MGSQSELRMATSIGICKSRPLPQHKLAISVDYPGPGFSQTGLQGINDSGEIVGTGANGQTAAAFVYSGGIFTTLDVPIPGWSGATGINDVGQIVGNGLYNFLLSGGNYTIFGGNQLDVFDINNYGRSAGTITTVGCCGASSPTAPHPIFRQSPNPPPSA